MWIAHSIERAVPADEIHGRAMVQRNVFCQKANPFASRSFAEGPAQHGAAATGREYKAKRNMNGCSLPGAIWTKKAEDFPRFHAQRKPNGRGNRTTPQPTVINRRS